RRTPATGRRLLVRPGPAAGEVEAGLIGAAAQIAENSGVSSVHFTFLTEPEW
ncbi:MAG TPA: GNAT family N-acetyltransferase, partial [Alphaproteobacteria bacterium]|nr:GNAT family N-acetyltransferase [Alphaproteobacteria bacterium]